MILIGGTGLKVEDLPFYGLIEYVLEGNTAVLGIKLKTIAKSEKCLGVYLNTNLDTLDISPDVLEKTIYFSTDEELFTLLDTAGQEDKTEETDTDTGTDIPNEADIIQVFNQTEQSEEEDFITDDEDFEPTPTEMETDSQGLFILPDADTDLTDALLSIPNIAEDEDSLKQQLNNKQRIVEQKDGIILDLKSQINDIYKMQEMQLLELRDKYEAQIDEANDIIENLRKQVADSGLTPELREFVKFATYSTNYKASMVEGFTEDDLKQLGKPTSKIHIFATGSGDSLHSMQKGVKALIDKSPNALIVDFTNDYFLRAVYRLQTRDSSMLLTNDSIDVANIVKDVNGVGLIPTTSYNDITLLNIDWVKVLKKLMVQASGRPIILLFGNVNSFPIRYTVSKLATIGQLLIFAKSNPIILSTLIGDIAFIPSNRFKVVALDYIESVKPVLMEIAKKHTVKALNGSTKGQINWDSLGVKL